MPRNGIVIWDAAGSTYSETKTKASAEKATKYFSPAAKSGTKDITITIPEGCSAKTVTDALGSRYEYHADWEGWDCMWVVKGTSRSCYLPGNRRAKEESPEPAAAAQGGKGESAKSATTTTTTTTTTTAASGTGNTSAPPPVWGAKLPGRRDRRRRRV
jgi:hypothetical protein